jgi:hypothetical protein
MANRVVAIVEHPMDDGADEDEPTARRRDADLPKLEFDA